MTQITAWQIEREVPGNARGEWQTITEHSLESQALYPARRVTVELTERARIGTYRQATWNVTHDGPEACVLVDIGGGFNRGEQAYSLDDAIHLGYAKVVG